MRTEFLLVVCLLLTLVACSPVLPPSVTDDTESTLSVPPQTSVDTAETSTAAPDTEFAPPDSETAVSPAPEETEARTDTVAETTAETDPPETYGPPKPTRDFDALQKQNADIYAWIEIPGTTLSYPLVQHPTDNAYYLKHNVEKKYDIYGAIFTEN